MDIIKRFFNYTQLARQSFKIKSAKDEDSKNEALKNISEKMGQMHGLPQKVGQLFSMSDAQHDNFKALTQNASFMPLESVIDILKSEWGVRDISDKLMEISPCLYAASIGQVHSAILCDGTQVAIKVQYPHVRENAEREIKAVGWLAQLKTPSYINIDTKAYRDELLRDFIEECSYENEAQNQRQFRDCYLHHKDILVPELIDELCTDKVLVSKWIDSQPFYEGLKSLSLTHRQKLANSLLSIFTKSLFDTGFMHVDPHDGNVGVVTTGDDVSLVLFDYGSMIHVDRQFCTSLLALIYATKNKIAVDLRGLMVNLGFDKDLLEPLVPKLPAICLILFEPFCQQGKYNLDDWKRDERISDVLGDDRWNFRMSGHPRFVFIMRVFHGLLRQLKLLDVDVSWSAQFNHYVDNHQQEVLDVIENHSNCSQETAQTFDGMAQHIMVNVYEGGHQKVKVTLPASRVDFLHELIQDDVKQKIQLRGIDLDKTVRNVRENCYRPQNVFTFNDEKTTISVELV